MKCFFHSVDLDGMASGAIIKLKYIDCEMFPINYGDPFPWDKIQNKDETVYMIDFCLQPFEDMLKLKDMCKLIWIDHHKAVIETHEALCKEKGLEVEIAGFRIKDEDAGCELVWEYEYPGIDAPRAIELLGRYDVWDISNPEWNFWILPFQYGMRLYDWMPTDEKSLSEWAYLLTPSEDEMNMITKFGDEGRILLKYEQQISKRLMKNAFKTVISQRFGKSVVLVYRAIAVNKCPPTGSILFESVFDLNKYDIMLAFGWNGKKWIVSLYSTKDEVDCGAIAKSYGGGGHKGAAGFLCDKLPFELS